MVTISVQIACLTLAQLAPNTELGSSEREAPSTTRPRAASADLFSPSTPIFRAAGSVGDRAPANRAGARTSLRDRNTPVFGSGRARQTTVAASMAQQLIDESTRRPVDESLDGEETSLLDILRQNLGGVRRVQAVRSYWRLAVAVCEYHFAWDEEQRLADVGQPRSEVDKALLEATSAVAAARRQKTKVEVLKRQHALAEDAQLPVFGESPWPQDLPLVGAYRTRFKNLFVGQPQPIRLHRIDRILPHLLDRINAQADAVSAGQRAMRAVLQAHQHGAASLSTLLDTHQQLSHHRRQFLAAVLEYNSQIADYATSVAGPSTPPEILVSTMITAANRDPVSSAPATTVSEIRRTSAVEPITSEPAPLVFREVESRPSPVKPEPSRAVAPRRFQPDGTSSVLKRISRVGDSDPSGLGDKR